MDGTGVMEKAKIQAERNGRKQMTIKRKVMKLSASIQNLQELRKTLEEGIHKLQSIHADDYDYGQYRLWARMIRNNQWKDFNNPPNLPMTTGKVSRKEKGGNAVVDTLATAAVAITKELKKDPTSTNKECALQVECPLVRRLSFAPNT